MTNMIERNRKRILNAALIRLQRKTGGNLLMVNLPDGKIETVEITESFMNKLLLRFEFLVYGEYGKKEGEDFIKSTYENSIEINRDTEYLTEAGKMIIDNLLNEIVDFVKDKQARGELKNGD
ncbi:hypothetical protein EC843_101705 [Buttiauxella sp. JUb87]|uniref:hypothetical protein n=1 Tax=Buttiauxella sp. JUb87 TaxID=2485129 RepID=UPI00105D22FC|nr:hypothetical protein [Buttiauxella sp. JUb87]TDN54654.1 hypothetical protein EC843_101705 [Buttiauxella sp. JUb87]